MAKVLLKVAPKAGDPTKPTTVGDVIIPANRGKYDQDFDLRDKLSELAVRGNSLNPDDKAAIYGYLTSNLGKDRAMKLMNHAYIFNSRPDVQRLSPEERLKSFYTIGSTDPEIMEVIGRTKNLGYGILPGYRESVSDLNQATQRGGVAVPVSQTVNPEVRRKVMLQVRK
jgi:hypothetical protein